MLPKSREFNTSSQKKTKELLHMLSEGGSASFPQLLERFKVPEIHYKDACSNGCHQMDKCGMARKALEVANYIVEGKEIYKGESKADNDQTKP